NNQYRQKSSKYSAVTSRSRNLQQVGAHHFADLSPVIETQLNNHASSSSTELFFTPTLQIRTLSYSITTTRSLSRK
ncbi:hypothetical protein GBAR_LOCUS7247, partial [Geodia barretti]